MSPEAPEGWRVGVLFSRSGTTAITETEHFNGTMLAVEEINAAGGVNGRPIIPVSYDPGSENSAYRALARRMLADDEIDIIFGGSMSIRLQTQLTY
ncbi:MAG: transporter substrate-binding protein [Hoeflea sp.]|nr:transporter substrate-binding protein [Hoeflea sp.]